jgi:hypothetical protein
VNTFHLTPLAARLLGVPPKLTAYARELVRRHEISEFSRNDRASYAIKHKYDCVEEAIAPLDLAETRRREPRTAKPELWNPRPRAKETR